MIQLLTIMKVQPLSFNTSVYKQKVVSVSFQGKINPPSKDAISDLKVFMHHIYEYKKGLRNLILTTEKSVNRDYIKYRLEKENIPYLIQDVSGKSINVFFGNEDCIKVVSTFDKHLSKLSPEQDFMLGIMLGYDKILQCKRYMQRLSNKLNPFKA